MDSDNWNKPSDIVWALKEASGHAGFMPNAKETAEFLTSLERSGLLERSQVAPVWHITNKGREELAKLERAR